MTSAEPAKNVLQGMLSRWFSKKNAFMPAVPAGVRAYVVGDIHGCIAQLDQLLTRIREDVSSAKQPAMLVFVGDYVDRGPDSKGVIDRLLGLSPEFDLHCLRGNHDQAILDFLRDPLFYRTWKNYGAAETLLSYGVRPPRFDDPAHILACQAEFAAALPEQHRRFLEGLELSFGIGDYFIVHAGVRPGMSLDAQVAEDMLWIRDDFLQSNDNFGKMIVHGHTPSEGPVRRRNRIGIDTGTYATGRLTALVLEGTEQRFLQN